MEVGGFIRSVINVGVEVFVHAEVLFFFNQVFKIFANIVKVDQFFNLLIVDEIIHRCQLFDSFNIQESGGSGQISGQ